MTEFLNGRVFHSEEAKLSHALRNINRRHFLPIIKGFSNKRQWDFGPPTCVDTGQDNLSREEKCLHV